MLTVLYVWGRNSWASGAIQSGALGLYCFNDAVVDEIDEEAALGAVISQHRRLRWGPKDRFTWGESSRFERRGIGRFGRKT